MKPGVFKLRASEANLCSPAEGDWEVNEVEVEVVQAQVVQRALARGAHVLLAVVRVPQLGRDPEVGLPLPGGVRLVTERTLLYYWLSSIN